MTNILVVFGTRPEAIKLLPLVNELRGHPDKFNIKVCVTAQHRTMLDQVLNLFKTHPDFDLNLMTRNQTLNKLTQKILSKLEPVLLETKPDYLIIQGDTTTTFAASLLAFYHKIEIIHIEAGLRTDNRYSPFPEEINRRLTSVLTSLHFVPTKEAKDNLIRENYPEKNIFITGNTCIDALFHTLNLIKNDKPDFSELPGFDWNKKIILVTGHRRENFGDGFKNICQALKQIALDNPDVNIIYPVHLNPNVRKVVFDMLSSQKNIFLIEPVEYKQFVYLMNTSDIILTDSGGVQEEAPCLGKPVIVMRETTERPEILTLGAGKLVGTDKKKIISEVNVLLNNQIEYQKMAIKRNIFGDGKASKYICNYLLK